MLWFLCIFMRAIYIHRFRVPCKEPKRISYMDNLSHSSGLYCRTSYDGTSVRSFFAYAIGKTRGDFMKKFQSAYLFLACSIYIYGITSLFLLSGVGHGESKRAIYDMGVIFQKTSESLTDNADYRQAFYAPYTCNGIQICFATDRTEALNDVTIYIYDSTEMLLGEYIVSHEQIQDNQYIDIFFEDFLLKEGNRYFFEACILGEAPNPIRFWMGQTSSEFCMFVQYQGELLENTSIAFNLIYEYTDGKFIAWLFVSVIFLVILVQLLEKHSKQRKRYRNREETENDFKKKHRKNE